MFYPNKILWVENGCLMRHNCHHGASSISGSIFFVFDFIEAIWHYFKYYRSDVRKHNKVKVICKREGHDWNWYKYETEIGIYKHGHCYRCHKSSPWYRPDGSIIDTSKKGWMCQEYHFASCLYRKGDYWYCPDCNKPIKKVEQEWLGYEEKNKISFLEGIYCEAHGLPLPNEQHSNYMSTG